MSAICGILRLRGAAVPAAALTRMQAALCAHGIHSAGSWSNDHAGLAHRLTRFTREDDWERQPVVVGAGELVLVCDGRIDNRSELASELGIPPAEARCMPDSALVWRAYDRWAERCLTKVVGEFSMAVWNGRRQCLFIGCSAPLARPIYYRLGGDSFAFASRPRGLLALDGVRRRLDEEQTAAFLTASITDPGRSFFMGIRRLLPGQSITVARAGLELEQWWRPVLSNAGRTVSDAECLEGFSALLGRVVQDHLRGEGPIAMTLSGGLDSGCIAAEAAPRLASAGRRLAGYTAVPGPGVKVAMVDGHYADESPRVGALAEMYPNLDSQLVVDPETGILDQLDRYFDHAEVPFRNAVNRSWMEAIYARARAHGARVLLSGDQGNLTASWDGSGLLSELVGRGNLMRALHEARALSRAGASSSVWRALIGGVIVPRLPAPAAWGLLSCKHPSQAIRPDPRLRPLLNPDFAAAHGLPLPTRRSHRHPAEHMRNGGREMRQRIVVRTGALAGDVIAGFRACYDLDTRVPLADRRLVEFCLALSEEQYARDGERRLLVRRAMARRLPTPMLSTDGRGLQAPTWFQSMTAERPRLLEEVDAFAVHDATARMLDVPRLRRLLERWPDSPPTDAASFVVYRWMVSLTLVTGRFLLWAERSGDGPNGHGRASSDPKVPDHELAADDRRRLSDR